MSNIGKTGYSRVFLIEGGARPGNTPAYMDCMKAGGASWGFGDITSIECPSAVNYDQFDEVDTIRGTQERPTLALTGRYAADVESALLRTAKLGCGADAQVHFGACTNPSDFNEFTKAVVIEDARISNWSTSDLGALGSDERAGVDETADLSGRTLYEILQLSVTERAGSVVTNEVLDVVICDLPACGECAIESTGAQYAYAITKAAGGSPGTPADILSTKDAGATWYADDIDSLGIAEDPSAVGCVGLYVVVVSNDSGSLHYALKSEIDTVGLDEDWTENATGFVGAPNDCWRVPAGSYLYIVGDSGYIYRTDDPTAGVTVLDAGVATAQNLNKVHMLSDTFGVAVGNNGAVVYTETGTAWSLVPGPVGGGVHLTAVVVQDELSWLVGTSAGTLYYTNDKGTSWTIKGFPGSGAGYVWDLCLSTQAVLYMAHATATPAGRILRSYSGGNSWIVLPEGVGTIPANDRITAVTANAYDANFVIGVGLADNATDGIIVVGED